MRKITNGIVAAGAMLAIGLPSTVQADVVVRGEEGKPLSEIRKAPASIYPDLQYHRCPALAIRSEAGIPRPCGDAEIRPYRP